MVRPADLLVWLEDVDKEDARYVGGKAANLGEMIQAKFPVPNGFVITENAYRQFIKENKLDLKIKHILGTVSYSHQDSLSQVSRSIKKLITTSKIPDEISNEVFKFYRDLDKEPYVAIRSSATSEDSKDASFAGQQETYLNVRGESSLLEEVRAAWASLFEPRALFYRNEKKKNNLDAGIALVVQKMVESASSGVMFTVDPVTGDKTKVTIEAIFGLGEYIVQGTVTPDHYEVEKKSDVIYQKRIAEQKVYLTKVGRENKEKKVSILKRFSQKISDKDIITLATLGKAIEKHYYFPQDIEWAKEDGKIFIVQTRPITTIGSEKKGVKEEKIVGKTSRGRAILVGDPASPGVGIGAVKVLSSPKQIDKVRQGDILVAPYTNPDYVPAMKRAAAIVTERGGRTSHAAIVSREFGIPAVVGAYNATKILKDNNIVTVNGTSGEVYDGSVLIKQSKEEESHLMTKTHLYVNLAEPEISERVAQMNVDGVGLLRAEFMIAEIGTHPKKLIKDHKEKIFIDKLSEGLEKIARSFYPRPVIYRATDFKTNEYKNLIGGKEFEPEESNPMLGYRGAYRYLSDPRVFKLELSAIKKVREKGFANLNLMIPFVRTIKELRLVKDIVGESGLRRSATFRFYMMAEIPSNVILIDDFIEEGIDGVSIGSNDLTMLTLGIDRDNEEVAREFDEENKAVLWSLERVVRACKKHGILSSICGQAPSNSTSLVEKLVEWGISSISVSPDAIDRTRKSIYSVERSLR